jgi:hypothetical protein
MYRMVAVSNTHVKRKNVRLSNNRESRWIQLAEDAERGAEKAKERARQLLKAASIFRQNDESGVAFPSTELGNVGAKRSQ